MSAAHGQSQYQVRFDWGVVGAIDIATNADVIVLVDVLASTRGESVAASLPGGPAVIAGDLRVSAAVASWILERQGAAGRRLTIAVVAAGEERDDGSPRFAVEDQLGAGAIINALAEVGIDYCSPEAAVAAAAYSGLRGAVGHLITASASGRELSAAGEIDLVRSVSRGESASVVILREFGMPS